MNKGFDCCISLGWYCGTASSMGRCGLRSHSGPFDWYFSDLESVLKVIETDFSDFMKKENLVVDNTDHTVFIDMKYGFRCIHDIHCDFETEYPSIYQKYMHRAEQFLQDTKRPTCFIRAVRSEEEIQFIEDRKEYIRETIKKRNPKNEIIFLLLKNMKGLSDSCTFRWFRLGITSYIGYPYEMRTMFESSMTFSSFCAKEIFSENILKRNKKFDREHMDMSKRMSVFVNQLDRGRCNIEQVIKEYWKKIEQGIYLWGAGRYGMIVLRYLLRNGIKVKGVIDNDPDKIGTLCENIPVRHYSIISEDCACILIAIGSAVSETEIKNQIVNKVPGSKVLGITDLVIHPLILDQL